MHHPYLVCILFGMPSLHLFTFFYFLVLIGFDIWLCTPLGETEWLTTSWLLTFGRDATWFYAATTLLFQEQHAAEWLEVGWWHLFLVLSVHTLKLVLQKYPPSQIPIFVILRGILNDLNKNNVSTWWWQSSLYYEHNQWKENGHWNAGANCILSTNYRVSCLRPLGISWIVSIIQAGMEWE